MHKNLLIVGLQILALLGLADSIYLSYTELTGSALACNIKGLDGCNIVAQSIYSHLFGIPLGVYGVVFYVLLFVLTLAVMRVSARLAHDLLAGIATIGFLASIVFMLIQEFLIKALCVYCLGSAIISFFAFILALLLWKQFKVPSKAETPPVVTTPAL